MTKSPLGWRDSLLEILKEQFGNQPEFTLQQVYQVAYDKLQAEHPNCQNVNANIRFTLQGLRDRNIINFTGNNGTYTWAWCSEETTQTPDGYIYIIENLLNGGYKIGKTTQPDKRFTQLKVGKKARVIGLWKTPDFAAIEKELHREYKDYRVPQSEWFVLGEQKLLEVVELLEYANNTECEELDLPTLNQPITFRQKVLYWVKTYLPTFYRPFSPLLAN